MIENAFYSPEFHGDYEMFDLGDFVLEEGVTLRGAQLAYKTFGTLDEAKSNAILVTTWYSGTHQIWDDIYIGPERALNPERYFIVVINQLGSGLSTSPHNYPGTFSMGNFPRVRISDDVRAQEQLLRERFGIEKLALVTGGSMGAQQTYEWAVRFPEKVRRAAAIAGTAKLTPHCAIWVKANVDTMTADPEFNDGFYTRQADLRKAFARKANLFALMGFSPEFWSTEKWATLGFSSVEDFRVGFLEAYFAPMDVNDLLCQAWKWGNGDVSRNTGGDLAAALGRITARTFVMPISTDWFFPPEDCAAEEALIPNSELRVIESNSGHLGLFNLEPEYIEQVDGYLNELLESGV
ncbi:alpha/beta fold hydrolase [Rubrobacter indicoceani]|uniref:alpha/beta fold hydrolase n=1 Tax=Rubrobacter indicoceani TaxID=2051957 RepID=UPI000E5A28B3|nr:alpha/beta fold hydrolase [Rubrobacter indicoceani]